MNLKGIEVGPPAPEPRSKGGLEEEGQKKQEKRKKEFAQRLGWLIGDFYRKKKFGKSQSEQSLGWTNI